MRKNHPIVDKSETVEVSRCARLSLNAPDVASMSVNEALSGNWFATSGGTMDVMVTVKTGPHSGATAYKRHGTVFAHYDPLLESPCGNPLPV